MANFIISPNMGMPVPTPGQDLGPDYATNNSNSLNIVDGHNHALGKGAQINPAGLNINADLPINSNNLTLVKSVQLVSQSSTLPGSSPYLNTAYASAGDLYFNDGSGNVVQITKLGAVNATSSGISSGTASAAFSGGVLVVNSNTNTPGNIQAGSILIGNNVSGSNFAQLQAPSSLGANYSLTLPATNTSGSTAFLVYDTSNNMAAGPALTGGITASNIANGTITNTQISASAAIARSKLGVANFATSSSCGNYGQASASFQAITNLSVTITTSGSPVLITLQNDGSTNNSLFLGNASTSIILRLVNVSTGNVFNYSYIGTGAGVLYYTAPSGIIDSAPANGVNTYTLFAANTGGLSFTYFTLTAAEL